MAGYNGWSLRQGNVQGLNPRQYQQQQQQLSTPHNRMQIACRLCNRAFLSTQALISHIETHMVGDVAVTSNTKQLQQQQQQQDFISYQRDMFSNTNPSRYASFPLAPPPPPAPPMSHKTEPFFPVQFPGGASTQMASQPPPPIVPPPTPPLASPSIVRNNVAFGQMAAGAVAPQQRVVVEERIMPSDYTKPLLGLLEHPIQKVAMVADNPNGNYSSNFNSDKLDLTLKL